MQWKKLWTGQSRFRTTHECRDIYSRHGIKDALSNQNNSQLADWWTVLAMQYIARRRRQDRVEGSNGQRRADCQRRNSGRHCSAVSVVVTRKTKSTVGAFQRHIVVVAVVAGGVCCSALCVNVGDIASQHRQQLRYLHTTAPSCDRSLPQFLHFIL